MTLHQAILEVLKGHVGKENRITRWQLRREASLKTLYYFIDDRKMRDAIKELREQGHLICSTSAKGGGYWLAGTPKEADDMETDYRKRALSCLMTASKIRKSKRLRFGGQMEIGL